MAINFKLVTEFQTIHRRSFSLAAPAILKPTNVRPIVDGEFLALDSAYKMVRQGDNNATTNDEATVPSFAYFAEQGRYEVQTIQKGPFLYGGFYEADTKIFDGTSVVVGSPLTVLDVDIGGIVRRGLGLGTVGTHFIVGYATRLAAANNGYLRFIRTGT